MSGSPVPFGTGPCPTFSCAIALFSSYLPLPNRIFSRCDYYIITELDAETAILRTERSSISRQITSISSATPL